MDKIDFITQIETLTAEEIAEGIADGIVKFKELRETGEFVFSKQKRVNAILKKEDDDIFNAAVTIAELENYLSQFPDGNHSHEAVEKIRQIKQKQEEIEILIHGIKEDINKYTPDELTGKFDGEVLDDLCRELGIDAQIVKNFKEPVLRFNDIPQKDCDIPAGYTDVFFWGIPSSGKTCALSAILSTIKKDYSMEAPDCKRQFGATYRASLVNIFLNGFGYLPGRTNEDRTQYMPFLLYRRGETNKRKISFFELSGEVFKYFFEKSNNSHIIDEYTRDAIERSFQSLDLLLNSNNQKIHFFFIDYNQETKHTADENGLYQSEYLEAAATYFRDNNEIFKKKTDAVYVVVTKSDEIPGDDKLTSAKHFLDENFGAFMDVLKNQCKRNSVDFKVKLFSIGEVYFKKICKINREYSTDIINDLLNRVKPASDSKFKNFFNS